MEGKATLENLRKKVKDLEKRLTQSECEKKAILENLPFLVWIKNIDGVITYANEAYLDFCNLKADQVIGKTDFDIYSLEDAQQYHADDQKIIKERRILSFQNKHGNDWYASVKAPVYGDNGEVIGISGFSRNITESIETLNILRNERDLLKALMDNIPDKIYFKDIHSRFKKINKVKAEEMGLTDPNDALGKTDLELISDQGKAHEYYNDDLEVIKTGKPLINKEEKITDYSGSTYWISTTKSPIRDEDGNIKGIVCISRDISHQKEIVQKLNIERDFLQVLMDNIPFTIYFKDLECRFTKINKAQARLIGAETPDEAIGKTDFDYFSKQHAEIAYEDEKKIISTGIPLIEKVEHFKDGEGIFRWVSATKVPVKDDKGNITGIVGISIDITEKRMAEEKLRESKEKAEESDRLKTAFLANMSHEIRTPMNGIIGFSNLLRNPELTEEERNEFLNHITNCGSTLLNLIDDIIDISKIEAGQIKIRLSESHINAILDELYDSFQAIKQREGKDHIQLIKKTPFPDKQAVVMTDPFRLRQIMLNLISNALKFTLEGFVEFGYSLQENKMLCFYVKDTGIGIPKDKQNLIFERFGQVTDTNNYYINQKGTGLGLAISSNLAKLLGGKMWLDSIQDEGSTFYFTIPYNMVENPAITNEFNYSTNGPINLQDKTIMIAEDEEINYLYFQELLKGSGVKLIWVKNGIEAIDLVKQNNNISLILMDCKMPQMDGYTATAEIKKLYKDIPIIAQTAFAMADEHDKSLQAGCDGYISKPINSRELFQIIVKYLK
jgi:PAS domain S-box-containing protein